MDETEIFISQESETSGNIALSRNIKPFTKGPKKDIMAFPFGWANTFGNNYYRQAQIKELQILNAKEWKIKEDRVSYNTNKLKVTTSEELENHIETLKIDMTKEIFNE